MKEVNGSFRITDGTYNGDNLSPKYYIMVRKGEVNQLEDPKPVVTAPFATVCLSPPFST